MTTACDIQVGKKFGIPPDELARFASLPPAEQAASGGSTP